MPNIKLSKIAKELNVGLGTIVDFMHENGYKDFEMNPNARLTDEQVDLLNKEFNKDKSTRIEAQKISQQRQSKEKKETVSIDDFGKEKNEVEEIKTVIPETKKPQVIGKIDLDSINKPHKKETPAAKEPEVKPVVKETPKVEKKEQPAAKQEPASAPQPQPQPKPEVKAVEAQEPKTENKEEEVFSLHKPHVESSLKVVGTVDLSSINQQTRPKKKSKDEKRKEKEERLQQQKAKNPNAGDADMPKKKRERIKHERIDVSSVAGKNGKGAKGDKFKKVAKVEVSEEDVQRQVKETLARLTHKSKSKSSKYRREKREEISQRIQEEEQQERLQEKTLKLTEFVTANELATMMNISVNDVILTCFNLGMPVSINQRLDAETINFVADEYGFKTEYVSAEVVEAIGEEEEDNEEDLLPRPPIVTVMGHVDHGKTSLLDYIRKSNVIAGEAGGITQHIGAYHVTLENGRRITFLDTPGHEAFTAMRARGAKVTDIAIIIVAADDSVMPQTVEAINHASAAGVPIVFAINKIDRDGANPDKIKEQLANMNYLVEEWGGKYQSQDISAKKGLHVNELLEKVLLESDLLELKANPNRKAVGSIIESSLDKGRGYVATILVQNGTLHIGDVILAGTSYGRVKAMFNERNQKITSVGPGEPALILGLNGAPQAGDNFNVLPNEHEAREIANKREQLQREQGMRTKKHLTLDELGRRIALGNFQELNIIVKGDVNGSIEALSDSLIKLSTPEIQVNVIHKAVGAISESDVMLAAASNAIIVGFQVRPSAGVRKIAEKEEIDIRLYSIIYDAIEEIKAAMEGMLSPEIKEEVTATIEVQQVFNISKVGSVAGCLVREGKVKRSDKVRLVRDGIVVFNGEMSALKRMKDDVKEVSVNFECGISLKNYQDIKVGDIIESYEEVEVQKKL